MGQQLSAFDLIPAKMKEDFWNILDEIKKVQFLEYEIMLLNYANQHLLPPLQRGKDNQEAEEYCTKGEQLTNCKMTDIIQHYNMSLALTEPHSELLAVYYSKRSALLYQYQLSHQCVKNVIYAKKSNCPEGLIPELNDRLQKCLTQIGLVIGYKKRTLGSAFHLRYGDHPKVPFVSSCLELRSNGHIYTKQDLQPGDLIAVEEAFSCGLMPRTQYLRCWFCAGESFELIPCPDCSEVMFCGEECRKYCSEYFHKYECPIITRLLQLNEMTLFSVRMLLATLSYFNNLEEFKRFCEDPRNVKSSIFEMDISNFNKIEYFKLFFGAQKEFLSIGRQNLLTIVASAAAAVKLFVDHTDLRYIFNTPRKKDFLRSRLIHYNKIFYFNSLDRPIRHSGFVVDSLSKHLQCSYDPNVVRIFLGYVNYMYVLRSIPKDTDLFEFIWENKFDPLSPCEWPDVVARTFTFQCPCDGNRCTYIHKWEVKEEFERITCDYVQNHIHRICGFIKNNEQKTYCKQLYAAKLNLIKSFKILLTLESR